MQVILHISIAQKLTRRGAGLLVSTAGKYHPVPVAGRL